MPKYKVIISSVIMVAALLLIFDKLFTPQPIQIILQSGQEITTSTSEYFTIAEVLLMAVCAFAIGASATYIFYNADSARNGAGSSSSGFYKTILPLLKKDEGRAVSMIIESKGELAQNKLCAMLGVSKVKMTRILAGLEQKGLIIKERRGFTNIVRLKK